MLMRTHFADFAGHNLAHEDRGMMQLIEVVDNETQVVHPLTGLQYLRQSRLAHHADVGWNKF